MSRLDRHYGTDASIDPATAQQINAWLQSHTYNNGLDTYLHRLRPGL
jgi:hypothetical protein